jgi:hypothetical protein
MKRLIAFFSMMLFLVVSLSASSETTVKPPGLQLQTFGPTVLLNIEAPAILPWNSPPLIYLNMAAIPTKELDSKATKPGIVYLPFDRARDGIRQSMIKSYNPNTTHKTLYARNSTIVCGFARDWVLMPLDAQILG